MKANRNTRLKFSVFLVAMLALNLASALSIQPAPSWQALLDETYEGDMAKVNILLGQGAGVFSNFFW